MSMTKHYYLIGTTEWGVARSQVYEWIRLLKTPELISIVVLSREITEEEKRETQGIKIIRLKLSSFCMVRELQYFWFLLSLCRKGMREGARIVFETRTLNAFPALAVCKLFGKVRIVFDARGAGEFTKRLSLKGALMDLVRQKLFVWRERNLLVLADKIMCVSEKLRGYYHVTYGIPGHKIAVRYGAADNGRFFYDERVRRDMRERYGLGEKIVMLYAGRLDKAWQVPERMISFYRALRKNMPQLIFFIITPDTDIAWRVCEEMEIPPGALVIKKEPYLTLPAYCNLADIGVLVRERALLNRVAAPTKFAEYILCGLPVLISSEIGDYSDMVAAQSLGYVLEPALLQCTTIGIRDIPPHFFSWGGEPAQRRRIAAFGNRYLSQQSYAGFLKELYNELFPREGQCAGS